MEKNKQTDFGAEGIHVRRGKAWGRGKRVDCCLLFSSPCLSLHGQDILYFESRSFWSIDECDAKKKTDEKTSQIKWQIKQENEV